MTRRLFDFFLMTGDSDKFTSGPLTFGGSSASSLLPLNLLLFLVPLVVLVREDFGLSLLLGLLALELAGDLEKNDLEDKFKN